MGNQGRLDELIIKYYDKLNSNDLYLYQYINANRKACRDLTIEELAARSHISKSSILRFAQKLSLRGYSELKVYLRLDEKEEREADKDILSVVCNDYHRAIEEFKNKNCETVCKMIYEAEHVYVYATGSMQASVGREFQRKFLYAKKHILTSEGKGEFQQILEMASPRDLIIMISLSGDSPYTVECARAIKIKNIPLIAFTKMKVNQLVRLSDESMYAGTSEITSATKDSYETSVLFFMMTEILLVKYLIYKENVEK